MRLFVVNINIILLFALISMVGMSCKQKEVKPSETPEFKEVMKWHDEAMAEMGTIYELKKSIQSSLGNIESDSLRQQAEDLIIRLEQADRGMMDWMADFQVPENASKEKFAAFFDEELKKVKKVHEDIFTSIDDASDFLNKISDEE